MTEKAVPKKDETNKLATKAARRVQKRSTNGDAPDGEKTNDNKRKPKSEMTLEELSLRAYKMTYEQLYGSKSKQK